MCIHTETIQSDGFSFVRCSTALCQLQGLPGVFRKSIVISVVSITGSDKPFFIQALRLPLHPVCAVLPAAVFGLAWLSQSISSEIKVVLLCLSVYHSTFYFHRVC